MTQEVLAAVHRKLPEFVPSAAQQPERAVDNWLREICRRHAVNHHRAVRRRRERICPADELDRAPARTADNETAYDERETSSLLFELLGRLRPERRDVLVAYEIEGLSIRRIAMEQKIPVHTAWNRLRLGRADLRSASRSRCRA